MSILGRLVTGWARPWSFQIVDNSLYLQLMLWSIFCSKEEPKDKVFSTCGLVKGSGFSLCYCRKTLFLLWRA